MKYNYRYILFISLLLNIFLIFKACEYKPSKNVECFEVGNNGELQSRIIVNSYVDTTYDTTEVIVEIPREVIIPVYDTIKKLNTYTVPFEDSLLKGEIYSEVDGTLIHQEFNFQPKFPKYITRTDSVFITKPVLIQNKVRNKVFMGVNLGTNGRNFHIVPTVSLKTKKDLLINYGYNLVDGSHNVGIHRKIKLK